MEIKPNNWSAYLKWMQRILTHSGQSIKCIIYYIIKGWFTTAWRFKMDGKAYEQ
jgi:hypothetical protein